MSPRFLLRALRGRLGDFGADSRGALTIEFVLIFPILIFWWIASVVFFDVFRVTTMNERAAYAVADMLSRQTEEVDPAYLNGLNSVFGYLVDYSGRNGLRVTSVTYDEDDDEYSAQWSWGNAAKYPPLDSGDVEAMRNRIPVMPDGETVVLVETFLEYTPLWDRVGIAEQTFTTFIVVRPRFAPRLVFVGS